MIALPPHAPCGFAGSGEVDRDTLAVTCTTHRSWPLGVRVVDAPGCGRVFVVDPRTGVRVASQTFAPRPVRA